MVREGLCLQQNGLSRSGARDHGVTGLTGDSAVVSRAGYSEEVSKEGKGKNRSVTAQRFVRFRAV